MSNLSGRIAVYTTPEKKAEVEAAIAASGRTQQEWLRDALEHALHLTLPMKTTAKPN